MTRPKQFTERDLTKELKWPTLSPSSLSSFLYDKEKWYISYVLGIRTEPNGLMQIGIDVGEKLASDPTYLPEVKRYDTMEQRLNGKLGNISLRGHIDTFDSKTKNFAEFKTSVSKNRWTQKICDENDQLCFYYLLIWLNFKISPENITSHLYFIHCEQQSDFSFIEKEVKIFHVKKTMKDILVFSHKLKKIYKDMVEFVALKQGR